MRRLPKGAPVRGRVCERCVRCKGGAVPGVLDSLEVRGRVRKETPGRLCSSASMRRASEECRGLGGTENAARSGDGSMASPNKEMET